jgi:hypothetical protein
LIVAARSATSRTSSSCTSACTISREPAMQVCPVAANTPAIRPFAAACRSASANTTCGDFPPSSRVTLFRFSAAACATARPVAVEPVNATLSTPGCDARCAPVSRDSPVTTLTTPGGKPACSISSANPSVDAGACSDGLITIVQPAASAGASFQVMSSSGEFHGVIAATTPTGSRRV